MSYHHYNVYLEDSTILRKVDQACTGILSRAINPYYNHRNFNGDISVGEITSPVKELELFGVHNIENRVERLTYGHWDAIDHYLATNGLPSFGIYLAEFAIKRRPLVFDFDEHNPLKLYISFAIIRGVFETIQPLKKNIKACSDLNIEQTPVQQHSWLQWLKPDNVQTALTNIEAVMSNYQPISWWGWNLFAIDSQNGPKLASYYVNGSHTKTPKEAIKAVELEKLDLVKKEVPTYA